MHTLLHPLLGAACAALLLTPAANALQGYPITELTPPTPTPFSSFGLEVDASSGHIAATSTSHTQPGGGTGGAWVFEAGTSSFGPGFELVTSDQLVSASYGSSIAVDGDTVVVGQMRDDTILNDAGSLYVFVREPGGTWSEVQKLTASDPTAGAEFGESVALEGDRLVVGAPGAKAVNGSGSTVTCGAAYVFERGTNGLWTETAKLVPDDFPGNDEFGFNVDLSGDRIIGGAHKEDDNGGSSGAAYVFEYDGSAWSQAQKLLDGDGDSNDYFGYDVAISGDHVAVGAWRDIDEEDVSGSVTMFVREPNGNYLETQRLVGSENTYRFGQALDLDGGTLVVGAFTSFIDFKFEGGELLRFSRLSNGTWTYSDSIFPPDHNGGDQLGLGVAISGGIIAAGQKEDDTSVTEGGSVMAAYNYVEGAPGSPLVQGTGTPGCDGAQVMDMLGPALLGNPDFGVVCTNTPTTGIGFLGLGGQPDIAGADHAGVGALIHLDLPNSPGLIAVPFPADASGTSELAFALPGDPALLGLTIHTQSVWRWTGVCSLPPFDYSSSSLLTFTIGSL